MRRNKYRRLRRTLRVEPRRDVRRARPLSRSVANISPDIQRYSYQISLRRLALKMRAMSKRLRSMETQLARGYKTMSGTKEEMENAPSIGGGLLWWDTDESVLYVHDDTGWQLSKATQAGSTTERLAYSPIFIGEMWWDTTLEQLFVWNGSMWDDVAVAHSGTTIEKDAYSQDAGDLWWDTTEREWYMDIGKGWQVISPDIDDDFARFPSLLRLFTAQYYGGEGYREQLNYGVIRYSERSDGSDPIDEKHGDALGLWAWCRPQLTINERPIICEWREAHWAPGGDLVARYLYSLEQDADVFSFGISTDGVRANRKYIETASISNINDRWHFVAGIYDPGNSIKIFHNGNWYTYSGTVPSSRYFETVETIYLRINHLNLAYYVDPTEDGNFDWAFCGIGTTAPSEELVERVYYRTKGFFT